MFRLLQLRGLLKSIANFEFPRITYILYNKLILGPTTLKEVRKVTKEHVLQKQKNVLGRSEAVPIKNIRFVTAYKGAVKKKKINEQ